MKEQNPMLSRPMAEPVSSRVKAALRRTTLADVAREAGLSTAAVSLALNRPADNCPLTEPTRLSAIEAAERLGYRANWRARALARGKTNMIGLLCRSETLFLTGFNGVLFGAIEEALYDAEYLLLFIPSLEGRPGWRGLISPDRLDGCLLTHPMPNRLAGILDGTVPLVLLNMLSPLPVAQFVCDDFNAGRDITRHLLEMGHRNIAYVHTRTDLPHYSLTERPQGIHAEMEKAGIAGKLQKFEGVDGGEAVERLIAQPLDQRPTALISYDDSVAIDLMGALWRKNLSVPRDVSLATFNDVDPMPRLNPPVTAVRLPASELGRLAADQLIRQINGEKLQPETVRLRGIVISRESTIPPARS